MKKNTHIRRHLTKCRRGAVQVEYAFLLVFVVVPTAAVLLAGGRQVYGTYLSTRAALLSSTP